MTGDLTDATRAAAEAIHAIRCGCKNPSDDVLAEEEYTVEEIAPFLNAAAYRRGIEDAIAAVMRATANEQQRTDDYSYMRSVGLQAAEEILRALLTPTPDGQET